MPRRKRDSTDEAEDHAPSNEGWCKVTFPTPFTSADSLAGPARTLQAKLIFDVRQTIVEKPNWREKFQNPDIWKKWQEEIKEHLAPKDDSQLLYWLAHGTIPMYDDGDEISAAGWGYLQKLLEWQSGRIDGPFMPSAVDGAWIADNLVSQEIKERLKSAVAPLENVPDSEKDWHPGSGKQVLDLVHPSLYCLVYGVTRQLTDGQIALPSLDYMGGGEIIEGSGAKHDAKRQKRSYWDSPAVDYDTSKRYQWLPSEFEIAEDGKTKISSYVNNIHPIKHKQLYFVLEEIFEKFVPMFNKVLRDLAGWDPQSFSTLEGENLWPTMAPEELNPYDYEEPLPEHVDEDEEDTEISEVMDMDDGLVAAELQADIAELGDEMNNEPQVLPVAFESNPSVDTSSDQDESEEDESNVKRPDSEGQESFRFIPPSTNDTIDIRGHRVQVIVKLANIVLTPETEGNAASNVTLEFESADQEEPEEAQVDDNNGDNSASFDNGDANLAGRFVQPSEDKALFTWRYQGGAWHVEGMKNEAIIATGIYYYESDNITESRLAFRKAISDPSSGSFDDGEHARLGRVYGLDNAMPLNESRGSIVTQSDRMICFPNILQHQVQPFELIDKTKPGHRKILVFFLIDPSKRIISTETVPPQQREWYGEALTRSVPEFARLPRELLYQQIIPNVTGCPMSLEEAKAHRQGLMEERKYFVNEYEEHVYQRAISLCEH